MSKKTIKITTKTGDGGESGLANGERFSKSHLIFAAIGDLDELNSWLGMITAEVASQKKQDQYSLELLMLRKMQQAIYVTSAELAGANLFSQTQGFMVKVDEELLQEIETSAERLQKDLEENWHQKFLYPGGVKLAAFCDLARTVCRRAERTIVGLAESEAEKSSVVVRPQVLAIINRFSDYLYLLRCFFNQQEGYQELQFEVERK